MRSYFLWIKLIFLCICFILIPIYHHIPTQVLPGYIVIVGAFLAIYFSLPLWEKKGFAYFFASSLIAILLLVIVSPVNLLPWIPFYFLLIDGMITPSRRERTYRVAGTLFPMSSVSFQLELGEILFFHLLLVLLVLGVGFLLQLYYSENRKVEKEWKSLLVEYRLLKRQVMESEEGARVEERNRIARDIHDSVGHQLTALMMQLAIAEQSVQEKKVKAILAQSKQLARESLDGMRKAVKALQGEEEKGISSVIHLIRKLEAESQMRVQLTTKTGVLSVGLTNKQNIAIYRFVQEGLTNAMRHGSSREIAVTVEMVGEHSLQITVVNKIEGPVMTTEGFGMVNMRKRLEALHGRMDRIVTENHFTIKGVFPLKGDR
ncbi:sensor histidine kinase [Sutcliffiella deserti]|uniref:sensor histidine kinase n=1 Tax=Sutcliffiella deserti TaxID=2875501 RepID=UPI001CC1554E|nr:sensor histidine kinase [Sutcliffiella deserti]